MADHEQKSEDKPKQQSSQPSPAQESPQEFAQEDLIARAPEYLGVPQHIAAGALHKSNKNLTLDDAKKAVKDWDKRPVEIEARFKPAEERKA